MDRYSWVDIGSSFLPNELTAAFLAAQMEQAEEINGRRMALWQSYHEAFADLEASGIVRRPVVPDRCAHNAHLYYLLLAELDQRTRFIADLKQRGIATAFHYVPLHDSLAGRRYCRAHGRLPVTIDTSERLVRLPLWLGLEPHQSRVIEAVHESLREGGGGE